MVLQILHSTKKAFYYNFFPTKAEEDFLKSRRRDPVRISHDRILFEMRDIYPPRAVDPDDPWVIKKTLSRYESVFGKIIFTCSDTFEHVIRHWALGIANYIAHGQRVGVTLWDVTEEENPRKYQNYGFYLQMMVNGECVLSCMELMKDRELKVDDVVYLYRDIKTSSFKFKVVVVCE
ncbi:hypothetical protein OROHE_001786 [Orobanche hederae]